MKMIYIMQCQICKKRHTPTRALHGNPKAGCLTFKHNFSIFFLCQKLLLGIVPALPRCFARIIGRTYDFQDIQSENFSCQLGDVAVPNTEVKAGGTPGTAAVAPGACEDGSVQCHDRQESHWCLEASFGKKPLETHGNEDFLGELPKKFANLKS